MEFGEHYVMMEPCKCPIVVCLSTHGWVEQRFKSVRYMAQAIAKTKVPFLLEHDLYFAPLRRLNSQEKSLFLAEFYRHTNDNIILYRPDRP